MKEPDRVFLQMWPPTRERLIASHEFYVAEAKRRLLDQFDDETMKADADRHSDEWLAARSRFFNTDRDNPADDYERAYDESVSFYLSLATLRDTTRLSIIAGMYHEWDKQIRDWLGKELGHNGFGQHSHNAVWAVTVDALLDLFERCEWPIRDRPYYYDLRVCQLVTNVYKHGNGPSLNELKGASPDLAGTAGDLPAFFVSVLDYSSLAVTDAHLARFADAITAFWQDVPENIFYSQVTKPPMWLEKALHKDQAARA